MHLSLVLTKAFISRDKNVFSSHVLQSFSEDFVTFLTGLQCCFVWYLNLDTL